MLLLPNSQDDTPAQGFPDHLDPHLVAYLPAAVTVARLAANAPAFLLLRYRGEGATSAGGLLQFQLVLAPVPDQVSTAAAARGQRVLPVPFEQGAFRLRLRSVQNEGAAGQVGDWHPVLSASADVATAQVGLTAHETSLLEALLEDGRAVVEVDLDLRYRGLVPGVPWLVTVHGPRLREHLATILGGPSSVEQIVMAFRSFPDAHDTVVWQALEQDAPVVSRDVLLAEVARRSLDLLFTREPMVESTDEPRYRLRSLAPDAPPTYAWDLLPPRPEQRSHHLTWSVTELMQELADPEVRRRVFPVLGQLDLFEQVNVFVVNRLPCDPAYLQRVRVDLRYVGGAGVPEHRMVEFDGTTTVLQFKATYPSVTQEFQLDYRLTAVLAPAGGVGWPTTLKRDWTRATSALVEVSRASAGIDIVRVEAEPRAFEQAKAIDVEVLADEESLEQQQAAPLALLTLTAVQPGAWVALPSIDPSASLRARAVAHPHGGHDMPPYVLLDAPIADRRVTLCAYQLEVLEPDRVTITLDPSATQRVAFVAVMVAPLVGEGKYYRLEDGVSLVWSCFRRSVFEPVRFRYRVDYVAFRADGSTAPLTSTDWAEATGTMLLIHPLVAGQESIP